MGAVTNFGKTAGRGKRSVLEFFAVAVAVSGQSLRSEPVAVAVIEFEMTAVAVKTAVLPRSYRGHSLRLIAIAVIKIELNKCRALFLRFNFFSVTIIDP